MSEDLLQDHADETDDFDAFENTGDLTEDSEERVVHVDDGNYGPTDDEDLSEVPPQSLDDVIDELHEHEETILAPISEQLKKPAGEILSPIALQGVSRHAKKRPISALDDRWLQSTWERISGLLSDQPDADEAPDWKHDVRLLEAAAEERELDLWAPAEEPAPKAAAAATTELTEAMRHASTGLDATSVVVRVPVKDIAPDPAQARDEGADDDLAELIKANGFYESKPIEVRPHPHAASSNVGFVARYMIVDGERRYRGALKAGLTHVPAMIVEASDEGERLLRQVNSNQGKPLKPLEEARAWKRIMDAKGWTAQQLADHAGRKKSTVGDRLALLEVPREFLPYFEQGALSAAAAPMLRPLMSLPDRARAKVVKAIIEGGDFRHMASNAVADGKPIALTGNWDSLENEIDGALRDELRPINPKSAVGYKGKTVKVGKTEYAVDVAAYDAAVKKADKAIDSKPVFPKTEISSAQKKANKENKDRLARERAAREKREADEALKAVLRDGQYAAVAAKIPDTMDAGWALLLLQFFLRDLAYDITPAALRAMGVAPPKNAAEGKGIGHVGEKLLGNHAANLPAKGRIRLLLQLLAYDPNPWGKEDRLADAARLTKIDLKKVKVSEPTFAGAPKDGGAKKSAKKAKR